MFQVLIVWHRHILLRYAQNRRVERIEYIFLNPIANLCTDTAERMVLFNNHNTMRLCDGIKDRLFIQRLDGAQIDNLGGDVSPFELGRDLVPTEQSARNK